MLKSFLTTAFRNLARRKGYTLLNLSGLALGMVCCLLIFEYVAYERSYDSFNPKADRIIRIQDEEYQQGGMAVPCASAMPGLAPAMKREMPEVEDACRLLRAGMALGNDERHVQFTDKETFFADAATIGILAIPLEQGNAATALAGPGKVILSADMAHKFFGEESPIGRLLTIHNNGRTTPLQVTGVFRNYPQNAHLKLNILISYPTYAQIIGTYGKPDDPTETAWGWTDFYNYALLKEGTDRKLLAAKLQALMDKNYNDLPENKNRQDRYTLSIMPLRDIHLYSHYTEEAETNGDGKSVSFLFLIAFFIIGIAWINYVNLATARSLERAREVGVRKVLGAMRQELIRLFMMESLLMNTLALLVALLIATLINPWFGMLTGHPFGSLIALPTLYWQGFAGLFLLGTFLSGLYPALVLSRYQPVLVLKGAFRNAAGGQWLRRGLIVGQFAASIILIAGTIIVFLQVSYMRNQDLGANINQTLVLKGADAGFSDSAYNSAFQSFKTEVLQLPGVKHMTTSSSVPGNEILWSTSWKRLRSLDQHSVNLFHLGVDDDFLSAYQVKLLAGHDFAPSYGDERHAVILNQTAARVLGFASPQAAIGELIGTSQSNMDSMQVVGVIADYHQEGLQSAIQPLVLLPHRERRGFYSVKLGTASIATTIPAIKKIWDRYFPADRYEYYFLDDHFKAQYAAEQRFGTVFGLFASLAILIACFGLLGLSAYNVLQRTKEIGIRKVLGASVQHLTFLLSRDFLLLVLVAMILAIPISWIAMHSWLQGFAYRINISWWIFALAGLLAIVVAFLVVSSQALKTAMANPVKNLRTE